jgi:hypothetical protein
MLRIVWDKKRLEHEIIKWPSNMTLMDHWIPLFVYIDEAEISGINEIPGGDITNIGSFFLNLMAVFKSIDPNNLGKTNFHFAYVNNENKVAGGGFEFFITFNEETDILAIKYNNRIKREYRIKTIPLKEFTGGVLMAVKEIIADLQRIDPDNSPNDEDIISLKIEYNTIRSWYEDRYKKTVENKYVIPDEYLNP